MKRTIKYNGKTYEIVTFAKGNDMTLHAELCVWISGPRCTWRDVPTGGPTWRKVLRQFGLDPQAFAH